MKGHLLKSIKEKRLKEIRKVQDLNMLEMNKKRIGTILEVTYDDIDYETEKFIGHTEKQMPGIDTRVVFDSDYVLDVGKQYKVKIERVDSYNLIGRTI